MTQLSGTTTVTECDRTTTPILIEACPGAFSRRPIDAAWLVMAVDCFPPPAFARAEPPTGAMSIDLTVHIHRSGFTLPGDGWLAGSFKMDDSNGGLATEHGRIQLDGTVVAESFQTRLTAQG